MSLCSQPNAFPLLGFQSRSPPQAQHQVLLPLPISASKTSCHICVCSPPSFSTHIQGLLLSLQGPTVTSPSTQPQPLRTGLPLNPYPSSPHQPQGKDQGTSTASRGCRGWTATWRDALQRVCVPAWDQGCAIQADLQFSSASEGLNHPEGSAADVPAQAVSPSPI